MDSSASPGFSCISQILNSWAEIYPRQSSDSQDLSRKVEATVKEQMQGLLLQELEQVTELDLQGVEAAESETAIFGLCAALQQRSFPRLWKLNLCDCGVDERGLAKLAQAAKSGNLSELRYLALSGNCLNDVGAIELAGMLETGNLFSLNNLHLLRTDLGDVGLVAIADPLKSGRVHDLRSLSIGSVKQSLTLTGTSALGKSFQSMPQLEDLQIQGIVDEEAVIAVVEALNSGMVGRIKSLELSYCGIGTEGAKAIAGCLESLNFASLECLDLSNNLETWMGDEGVVALARVLKTVFLYNLRKLVLNNVAMAEKGLLELADLLEGDDLPGLQELHVRDSGNTEASARALVKAYRVNPFVTSEIFVSWPDPSFEHSVNGLKRQNLRLVQSLRVLMDEPNVRCTHARIFIYGHPKVGKTTVKQSLSRLHSKEAGQLLPKAATCRCMPSRKIEDAEDQAFEIELSRNVHRSMFLGLWDVAGQPDQLLYPLLSDSLPHLAFVHGQPTLFVLVCSANYSLSPEMKSNENQAKKELHYWLRYIASNAVKIRDTKEEENRRRLHVLVVLNSFNGQHSCHSKIFWNEELRRCQKVFEEFLDIHSVPSIVDFHNPKEAKTFKRDLSKRLRDLLRVNGSVPRICSEIQQRISRWMKKTARRYPVLSWIDFRSKVLGSKGYLEKVSEDKVTAATEYLHEAGHLMYFRGGVLQEGGGLLEDLVILDPALFCETIFGRLLIPDALLGKGETSLRANLQASGALSIDLLQGHFVNQLSDPAQVPRVISTLVSLGLAYKFQSQPDHIFIPALLENDNVPAFWDGSQVSSLAPASSKSRWIMGLALKVAKPTTTLLPITAFRRFQMELAREQDEFGGLSPCNFYAGKSFVTFRNPEIAVAVQYSGDPLNRLDVLTKAEEPLELHDDRRADDEKKSQVNLAHAVLEKLELIASQTCPGLEFSRRVIEPWCSEYGLSKTMESRNVEISVEEVKILLKNGGVGARTDMTIGNEAVSAIQVLPSKDIKDLRLSTKEERALIEQAILHPELFELSVDPSIALMRAASTLAKAKIISDREEEQRVTKSYTLEKFFSRRVDEELLEKCKYNTDLIPADSASRGSKDSDEQILQWEFDHRKSLGNQLQKCIRYSLAKQESSMPRFLYLTAQPGEGGSEKWMTMETALLLRQSCVIHFLCEDRALHELRGQQGLKLSHLNELGYKLGPLLEWSFKMAFLACNIGRSARLPGLELLLRDEPTSSSKLMSTGQLAKISIQLKKLASAAPTDILKSGRSGATTERELASVREEVTSAFKGLLANMTQTERMQRVGLKRVMLSSTEHLWLCGDCCSRYGSPPEI